MKKILITGANGQLGKEILSHSLNIEFEMIGLSRNEMDVTNFEEVADIINSIKPDIVIHSAAFTHVDHAEINQNQAYAVNTWGTRNIAVCTEMVAAKLCYISTDYVFDGESKTAYSEFDKTNPINIYGQSKLAGEQMVTSLSSRFFIVRTSWLYGLAGNNFVKTMLSLSKMQDPVRVVHDQKGSPTYAKDLSKFLFELIITELYGIYHTSNSGSCTWFEFAQSIFLEAGIDKEIQPITSEEFPFRAKRPRFSVMNHMGLALNGFNEMRHWRDALREFLVEYKKIEFKDK